MDMQVDQSSSQESPAVRAGLCAYYLLMTTLITACVTLRLSSLFARSFNNLRRISLARGAVLFLLVDSWLISIVSTILIFGVDLSSSVAACSASIWFCIVLYGLAKMSSYIFLMERIYVAHTGKPTSSARFRDRFSSKWYCGAFVLMVGVLAAFGAVMFYRRTFYSSDGRCHIGVATHGMVPGLVIELVFSSYLTIGFIASLYSSGNLEMPESRRMAKRATIAAAVCMVTTIANLSILVAGHQQAYVCLALCLTDISINALVFYCVTLPRRGDPARNLHGSFGTVTVGSTHYPNAPVLPTIAMSDLHTTKLASHVYMDRSTTFEVHRRRDSVNTQDLDFDNSDQHRTGRDIVITLPHGEQWSESPEGGQDDVKGPGSLPELY